MEHYTIKERNAVKYLLTAGYRPVIGGFRDKHNFELALKETGEIEHFDIDDVVADYKQQQRDGARMRAADRRDAARGAA